MLLTRLVGPSKRLFRRDPLRLFGQPLELIAKVAMGRVAFALTAWQGARRKHTRRFAPLVPAQVCLWNEGRRWRAGAVTDEQRSQAVNAKQPEGPGSFCLAALSLARHVATAMLLTRSSPQAKIPAGAARVYFCNEF